MTKTLLGALAAALVAATATYAEPAIEEDSGGPLDQAPLRVTTFAEVEEDSGGPLDTRIVVRPTVSVADVTRPLSDGQGGA